MHLPGPLRAAVGLVATAASEAKHLPDRAIELPMLAVSTALQASLRAQQRYSRLAARGDEVLNRRTPTDEPPEWATFDEPVPGDDLRRPGFGTSSAGTGEGASARSMLDDLFGVDDPTATVDEPIDEIPTFDEGPLVAEPPAKAPRKASGKTAGETAKKAAKKAPATKAPARKAARKAAKKAVTKATPARTSAGTKTVSKPRHTAPSAFDNVVEPTADGGGHGSGPSGDD